MAHFTELSFEQFYKHSGPIHFLGITICGFILAGRVGFEPTICGSAGRRLGPGSTTGPETGVLVSPYNAYNLTPSILRIPNWHHFHMSTRVEFGP